MLSKSAYADQRPKNSAGCGPIFPGKIETGRPHGRALLAYAERLGTAFALRDDMMDGVASHAAQREATAIAYRAAEDNCQSFGTSRAALALAGMAIHAIERDAWSPS